VANTYWACPCNGCKKAQKVIIDQIIEEYKSCPNVVEAEERLYCYTWWRHDDCLRIMNLLNKITKNDKYSLPSTQLNNKNDVQYLDKYKNILKNMEDGGI
jgi:hypothetical protein